LLDERGVHWFNPTYGTTKKLRLNHLLDDLGFHCFNYGTTRKIRLKHLLDEVGVHSGSTQPTELVLM
jgi:hypothetical protein